MSDSSPKSGRKVVTSQQRIRKNHIVAQIFNSRIEMVEGVRLGTPKPSSVWFAGRQLPSGLSAESYSHQPVFSGVSAMHPGSAEDVLSLSRRPSKSKWGTFLKGRYSSTSSLLFMPHVSFSTNAKPANAASVGVKKSLLPDHTLL